MRPITKGPEPQAFLAWKALASNDWKPSWGALEDARPVKRALLEGLLREQGSVCCYCEQRIAQGRAHIEHLEPRSTESGRDVDVDHANLLASCGSQAIAAARHCGHRRGNRPLAVHPLIADCREFFLFAGDGRVRPTKDGARSQAADTAIQILGLDVSSLVAQRKKAIDGATEALKLAKTPEQMQRLMLLFDQRDRQEMNTPFASAIIGALLPKRASSQSGQ